MTADSRRPPRQKYREAAFFHRKLARADDGHLRTDGRIDADEVQFYCSAFCSATDEIHRQVAATADDHPRFEDWADDQTRALKAFFDDQCHDVVQVGKVWDEEGKETETGESGGQRLVTPTVRCCVGESVDVPERLREAYGTEEGNVPITDLADAYLGSLDAWLTAGESQDEDDTE